MVDKQHPTSQFHWYVYQPKFVEVVKLLVANGMQAEVAYDTAHDVFKCLKLPVYLIGKEP